MNKLTVAFVLAFVACVNADDEILNPPCVQDSDCLMWHTHQARSRCNLRRHECEAVPMPTFASTSEPFVGLGAKTGTCKPVQLQPNFNVTEFVRASCTSSFCLGILCVCSAS